MTGRYERQPAVAAPTRMRAFRPDIEGLRALAVILVVLYHVGVPGLDGAFVGVDMFFVISGFLITDLLFEELCGTGRIRLGHFYARRIRRLLPASVLVAVATLVLAWILLPPLALVRIRLDALATFSYNANNWFAMRHTNYLQGNDGTSLYQHYWSLAVEEQFYLLWPAMLVAAAAVFRRRGPVRGVLVALAVVCALSLCLSVFLTGVAQPWAFFGLPSRAWELGAGALIVLGIHRVRRLGRYRAQLLGWVGLGLVAAAVVLFGDGTPFPGWAAALPVAGTVLLVCSGTAPAGPLQAILGRPPLQLVGRLSYSIYLWHWPVLILAGGGPNGRLGGLRQSGLIAATVVLAWLTFRLVENPLRHGRWLSARPVRALGFAATATVLAATVAVMLSVPPVLHAGKVAPELKGRLPHPEDATGYVPANLTPSLKAAAHAFPAVFSDGCHNGFGDASVHPCVYGNPHATRTVVLFGDSHAADWFPPLRRIADTYGLRLTSLTKSGCPSASVRKMSRHLGREYRECDQWRERAFARIAQEKPALVILANSTNALRDPTRVPDDQWWPGMAETLRRLSAVPHVLVMADTPYAQQDVPTCLSGALDDASACDLDRASAVDAGFACAEATLVRLNGGEVLDLDGYLCSATVCPAIIDDTLVYLDKQHLSPQITTSLAGALASAVLPDLQ